MNWFSKLTRVKEDDRSELLKQKLLKERKKNIKDLKNLNRRFRLTIEGGTIDVVLKDIKEITEGK